MLFKGASRDKQGILWAFWTIVGCIDEQAVEMLQGEFSGPITNILFYSLLLVCNVLLVNLLIAVMNSTYVDNMNNSQFQWAFYRVQTVLEFDEWADLPPPLNIIELVVEVFTSLCFLVDPRWWWSWFVQGHDIDDEDGIIAARTRTLKTRRTEMPVNKRDLKDSQTKAMKAVGGDEESGQTSLLRKENEELQRRNGELLKRKEHLEGLALKYLLDHVGAAVTPSKKGDGADTARLHTSTSTLGLESFPIGCRSQTVGDTLHDSSQKPQFARRHTTLGLVTASSPSSGGSSGT